MNIPPLLSYTYIKRHIIYQAGASSKPNREETHKPDSTVPLTRHQRRSGPRLNCTIASSPPLTPFSMSFLIEQSAYSRGIMKLLSGPWQTMA